MDFTGKVILVTGGSSGIGKATCQHFASLGAKVCICDLDSNNGTALEVELNKKHGSGTAIFILCDVVDMNSFRECFKKAIAEFGYVDFLFNNAGIFDDGPNGYSREIDINLKGQVNGCSLAIEYMDKNEGGRGGTVVNNASIFGLIPNPNIPVYSATKAASVSLTRSLGTPWFYNTYNVKFVCVCPSFTRTNILNGPHGSRFVEKLKDTIVPPELQSPENVARSISHAIEAGDNGCVWLVKKDQPAQRVEFKNLEDHQTDGAPSVSVSV